ncbi:hypothetical protein PRZ48_014211 [Zasmidium cellare]|uniref:Ubiquitin-like protease family profile domain-containing protein n=1 Tax=Zasmidium cellare TaxID=395010 RepID=A0ABR0E0C3_ZASCE|nr:hypothetical protein PRZ48_014211 [Zasmidium cellare]
MPLIDPGDSNGDIMMTNTPKGWYKQTTTPRPVNTANYSLQERVRSRIPTHVSDYTQADHSLKRFSPPRDEIQFRADRILGSKNVYSDREAIMGISTTDTDSKRRAVTCAPSPQAEAGDMPGISTISTDTKRDAAGGAPSSEKNAWDINENQPRTPKQDQKAVGDLLIQRARSLQENWSADKAALEKLAEKDQMIVKLAKRLFNNRQLLANNNKTLGKLVRHNKELVAQQKKQDASHQKKVKQSAGQHTKKQLAKEPKRDVSHQVQAKQSTGEELQKPKTLPQDGEIKPSLQIKPKQSAAEEHQRPETHPQDGDLLAFLEVEVEKIGEPERHVSPQSKAEPSAEEHRRAPSKLQKDGDVETHLQVKAAPIAGQQQLKQQNRDISPQTKAVPSVEEHARTSGVLPKHGDVPRPDQEREALVRPLEPMWEKRVNDAMATPSHEEVLTTSCDGVGLTRRTIGKILPQRGTTDDQRGWLDDEAVNGWISEVVAGSLQQTGNVKEETVPRMAAYGSAWLKNYNKSGWKGLERWSKRKGINGEKLLSVEKVFFPVFSGSHWTLLVVSPIARTIEYLDSMEGDPQQYFRIARKFLAFELGSKYRAEDWKELDSKSQKQYNTNDCGVFTCMNALASAKGKSFAEVPAVVGMLAARRMMVAVLLNKGFHGDWKL